MATVSIQARIEESIKIKAQEVLEKQGLDISTAIKILLTKTANEGEFPMSLRTKDEKSVERQEMEKRVSLLLSKMASENRKIDPNNKKDMEDLLDGWD